MGSRRPEAHSRPLTREKIANVAIEIVREEGQSALSMRKVAACFDVDVAALYRHVENKDALLEEMGRIASEMVELDVPAEGSWEERFVTLGESIRDRITQHPELGIYGGGSPWATPFFAKANGAIAGLLCEAGLSGQELLFATQTVLHLVTSVAQTEVMTRATPKERNREFGRIVFASLPEEAQKAWPAARAKDNWAIDFNALFPSIMKATIHAVTPGFKGG